MKRHHRTRSSRIADFITGLWSTPKPDLVRHKMLFPRRGMRKWQTHELKREIRLRLMDYYGYTLDHMGRMIKQNIHPKPRIRYRLSLQRRPVVHTLPNGRKYEMFEYVYILLLVSCFFLSSASAEATNAGGTSIVTDFYNPRTHLRLPVGSIPYVPRAIKSPSVFTIGASPVPHRNVVWPKLPSEWDWFVCKTQLAQLENENKYNSLVNGPRPVPHDWRKFWAWLAAIGTGALALGSALLYGHWRSLK